MRCRKSGSKWLGSAIVTSAAMGRPAMAAMSLRQRPSALWPICSGSAVGGKMNALHDRVGLEQEIAARLAGIQHRAIIARPDNDRGIARQGARPLRDEFKFVHEMCSRRLIGSGKIK